MSFEVVREDQDAHLGVRRAYLLRRAQTVIGVPGGHLDVGDDHIRLVGHRLADEVVRVGGHADDLETGLFEDAHDALTSQGFVITDDNAHGLGLAHAPTLGHQLEIR